MTIQRSTRLTLRLAIAELVLPIIWMKIGPMGKAYYGPDVPDIYILGATILGKDLSFVPLLIAVIFQGVFGAVFIFCAFVAAKRAHRGLSMKLYAWAQLILLLLFPWWLSYYIAGVINNSDGAAHDIQIYPHVGVLVYVALVALVAFTVFRPVVKKA